MGGKDKTIRKVKMIRMDGKSALIEKISQMSKTRYGDELIKFMDTYGLQNLRSATSQQLQEYITNKENEGVEK
jgi:hypothetical protein